MRINLVFVKQRLAISVSLIVFFVSVINPVIAEPPPHPIITISVLDCQKIYLVKVFDNGGIEYRGRMGVKTIGNRYGKINQYSIRALLDNLKEAGLITANGRLRNKGNEDTFHDLGPAIRLQYAGQQATFFYDYTQPPYSQLHEKILHTTHADQWIGSLKPSICRSGDRYIFEFKHLLGN